MTSTEALRNKILPKKMIVIGGGYIGCEIGNAYASFGTKVIFIVRGNCFLQREDKDITGAFTKIFSRKNECHFNSDACKVEYRNKTFIVHLKKKKKSPLQRRGLQRKKQKKTLNCPSEEEKQENSHQGRSIAD